MSTSGRPKKPAASRKRPVPVCAGETLSAVPSTLRIPLAARAHGDRLFPELAAGDVHAARVLAAIGDDGSVWLQDRASVYGVLARTRRLRDLAGRFLAQHPDAHVVNLGCGLSHYFQWLDNGRVRMTDADLPEVMAIRRQLLPSADHRHGLREFDLAAPDWWESLELPASRDEPPVFLFSEGVLMYLRPERVESVLRTFGERAPAGSVFAFDAMCWLVAGQAAQHPSVRHTEAEFSWGPRRLEDLTAPSPRLRLISKHQVMSGSGWPYGVMGPVFWSFFGLPLYGFYELQTVDLPG